MIDVARSRLEIEIVDERNVVRRADDIRVQLTKEFVWNLPLIGPIGTARP